MATVTSIFEEHASLAAGIAQPRAVSWPAILAGATAAAALSLILLVLGMGLGFSVMSPWTYTAAAAHRITWGAIVWMIATAIWGFGLLINLGAYLRNPLRRSGIQHSGKVVDIAGWL